MVEIGEPEENPDTVVYPIRDPVPRKDPLPIPREPAPVRKEPKKVPA